MFVVVFVFAFVANLTHKTLHMYVCAYETLKRYLKHESRMFKLLLLYCTRGDQKVRGKVLLHRIAFIDCNENS